MAKARAGSRQLRLMCAVTILVSAAGCEQKKPDAEAVTVVSWGGQYQESLFQNWISPAAGRGAIQVVGKTYTGEYKTITRMVESRAVTWDLVQVETFYAARAMKRGWLCRFEPPLDPTRLAVPKQASGILAYACPVIGWSYALAWNRDNLAALPGEVPPPRDWSALWDLATYPGKRAMRDVPQGNIELALLASGMSRQDISHQLYQQGDLTLVTRALAKLDEIQGDIIWWTSGDQLQRELEGSRAILVAAWSGRVWAARRHPLTDPDQTADITLTFNNAILDYDWWIIPEHSPHSQLASELVAHMYDDAEGAIAFARDLGYAPPIAGWEEHIEKGDDLLLYMPTTQENVDKQLPTSPEFWADHYEAISEKWEAWRSKWR